MDFTNRNHAVLFQYKGITVYLTDTLIATWAVMALLVLLAVVVRIAVTRFKSVPKGFQNVIETLVEMMSNYTVSTMGPEFVNFGGFFFSLFAFILFSNYIGLIGLRPPTADLATTGALAIMAFLVIQGNALRMRKGKYFSDFLAPVPLFLPLNLISELSKPVSLAFRLFGNLLSGVIVIGLVYGMLPMALRFVLPSLLHAFFDVFVGALQAFIFTVLTMSFVQQKAIPD